MDSRYYFHRHHLVIDGVPSTDYEVYLSGNGTYKAAERELEEFTIPGRNGTFHYKAPNTYKNVKVPYDCFIFKDFEANVTAFRNFLLSKPGYVRIWDSHHPNEYRMGIYHEEFDPDVFDDLSAGQFTINFDCRPERWLTEGEIPITILPNTPTTITNPTPYIAKPLIRVYGTDGAVRVNSTRVTLYGITNSADIDCEAMETIPTSLNESTLLSNGEFPVLNPGNNLVVMTGFTSIAVYPRWWIL